LGCSLGPTAVEVAVPQELAAIAIVPQPQELKAAWGSWQGRCQMARKVSQPWGQRNYHEYKINTDNKKNKTTCQEQEQFKQTRQRTNNKHLNKNHESRAKKHIKAKTPKKNKPE
jgi:hypothetical protein